MKKWSRKADPARDEKVYLIGLEARRAWKSVPPHEKLAGQSAADYAKDVLEKEHGISFNDTPGFLKAFYRGAKVHRSQNFTTRKTGRQDNPDLVQQVIIFDLVSDAVEKGHSLREAYRIAAEDEWAMIFKHSRPYRPSAGAVKAIYLKMLKLHATP